MPLLVGFLLPMSYCCYCYVCLIYWTHRSGLATVWRVSCPIWHHQPYSIDINGVGWGWWLSPNWARITTRTTDNRTLITRSRTSSPFPAWQLPEESEKKGSFLIRTCPTDTEWGIVVLNNHTVADCYDCLQARWCWPAEWWFFFYIKLRKCWFRLKSFVDCNHISQ